MPDNSNRARDHLANERTFLAWVRTAAAIVVFGFAIGRFSIAMRQLTMLQGHPVHTAGLSVWMGAVSIVSPFLNFFRANTPCPCRLLDFNSTPSAR